LFAELVGAILAFEEAQVRGYNHLWLESDSTLVYDAFESNLFVP